MKRLKQRSGTSLTELLVAGTLMITGVSVLATCFSAVQQLGRQQRYYAVAVDELANQMERLLALSQEERSAELESLPPTEFLESMLPQATLKGQEISDEHGTRLQLQIDWHPSGAGEPLVAVAWIPESSVEVKAEVEE